MFEFVVREVTCFQTYFYKHVLMIYFIQGITTLRRRRIATPHKWQLTPVAIRKFVCFAPNIRLFACTNHSSREFTHHAIQHQWPNPNSTPLFETQPSCIHKTWRVWRKERQKMTHAAKEEECHCGGSGYLCMVCVYPWSFAFCYSFNRKKKPPRSFNAGKLMKNRERLHLYGNFMAPKHKLV